MSAIAANLQAIRLRVASSAQAAGRQPDAVRLIAVSKTFPADAILAAIAAGQFAFGENYVQEALEKISLLKSATDAPLEWHFIGPIQSNKTRQIAENFDWVHSVDRLKVAQRLSEQRPDVLPPLNVCIQVNISLEASKSGVLPSETAALAHAVAALPKLRLRGLMAIPEPAGDPALQAAPFAALRTLGEQLVREGLDCHELSMGMSADLDAAVAEGATLVRVGSAIFGSRTPVLASTAQ